MPRPPRLQLPGVPQHLIQRGNNRQRCFFLEADYLRYLAMLREAAGQHACAVHAYVLMPNHVHLLVTPSRSGSVSGMMQRLGSRYVRYINRAYERSGTLWEGRFKACPVNSGRYLLACYRYIELNPVRAGMIISPASYRWSSYPANALGRADPVIRRHPFYMRLGACPVSRAAAYQELAAEPLGEGVLAEIRTHTERQKPLASAKGHSPAGLSGTSPTAGPEDIADPAVNYSSQRLARV